MIIEERELLHQPTGSRGKEKKNIERTVFTWKILDVFVPDDVINLSDYYLIDQ